MTKEEKSQFIDTLAEKINASNVIYLADIAGLNAGKSSNLRRACFKNDVKLEVVKNTLLKKAFDKAEGDYEELYQTLVGNTSIMFAQVGNTPAKIIKDFRKKADKPILKGAFIDEAIYLGDDNVDFLSAIKSKEELIGEIVTLLQSPTKNVVSALQASGGKLAGIVKTLSER